MSKADVIFKQTCRDIIDNGTDTQGEIVRPHWPDGTPAYTLKQFGVINTYDLREEFPAMTLRRIALKSAWDEILWIYQKKSNRIADLNSHIWDSWAGEDGTIGTCYGYVIGDKFIYKGEEIDQMDYVLKQLKENPYSRRIMTNMYQYKYLHSGGLDPCCYSMTYNVTKENGQLVLNATLNQRSQDMLTANNWNVCQYAMLTMMMAQVAGLKPGELVHVIADCHIYDRHIPAVRAMLENEGFEAPKFTVDPTVTDFYAFTKDSFKMEGYRFHEFNFDIPMAI